MLRNVRNPLSRYKSLVSPNLIPSLHVVTPALFFPLTIAPTPLLRALWPLCSHFLGHMLLWGGGGSNIGVTLEGCTA